MKGLPQCLDGKEPTCRAEATGDMGFVPGLGRSSGGEHGNPLQDPCLRIPWTEKPSGLQPMGSQKSWP